MIPSREVCAVLTTFQPDQSLRERVETVSGQVGEVIVVDDTGTSNGGEMPFELESCVYIRNDENIGIACALNRGVLKARELGYRWVLTLDDDTVLDGDYVQRLSDIVDGFVERSESVGVVALSRRTLDDAQVEGEEQFESGYQEVRGLITSGSMFSFETYMKVGGFREELFIDLVDLDFCTRIRRSGMRVVRAAASGMKHSVGNSRQRRILGFVVNVYCHTPFRLYYQVRNAVLFFRAHALFDPVLSLYVLIDVFRVPMKSLLFEPSKVRRLRFALNGLLHGVIGRSGRL